MTAHLLLRLTAPYQLATSLAGSLLCSLWLAFDTLYHPRASLLSLRPRFIHSLRGIGFLTDSPSPTLSPRLRPRLPLGGLAFPRIPLGFRRSGFSPDSRYLYRHSLFHTVQFGSLLTFFPYGSLPYQSFLSTVSVSCFSPGSFSARCHSTSELLRTLLMCGCF